MNNTSLQTSLHLTPRLLLIPGYWLGSWAWDNVTNALRTFGFDAQGLTLPGLESRSLSRAQIHFADHVEYVVSIIKEGQQPVILVAHSGAGAVITAVADAVPQAIARIIYVDSGPALNHTIPRPDITHQDIELPFPGFATLVKNGARIQGLSIDTQQRVADLAVPQPAGSICEAITLHHPERNHIPVSVICCSITSAQIQQLIKSGEPMFAAMNELVNFSLVDLPTGHWPMFSKPRELATVITRELQDL
jgi:pimeloyl-ACP methyl ester carboxylesterase